MTAPFLAPDADAAVAEIVRCDSCRRPLTDPLSRRLRIGPTCRGNDPAFAPLAMTDIDGQLALEEAPMTEPEPIPEPIVQPTQYQVSLLPEDDVNYPAFTVTVEYRGGDRWAITRHGACLGADGDWAPGVKPYGRADAWLDTHRFDLETALALAKAAAPGLTVNGHTAADAYRQTRDRA